VLERSHSSFTHGAGHEPSLGAAAANSAASQAEVEGIVTNSPVMQQVVLFAQRVAGVDSNVLILGESGVGKGMLANLIHRAGKRKNLPLIKISCGAIPETLLESELFGYESGAFTGARKEGKRGLFEVAAGGTVFLDEIGELPLSLQSKLLNVLQDRCFMRVGGSKIISTRARIIAATNRNLERQVQEGYFREDLYYRLNVIPLLIPPLRERRMDILPLINHFLNLYCGHYEFERKLSKVTLKYLTKYDWPGNVRELQNTLEFLVVMAPGKVIMSEQLPDKIRRAVDARLVPGRKKNRICLKEALEDYERTLIARALDEYDTLREAADY